MTLPRKLIAAVERAAETGDAVYFDLDTGEWATGRGRVIDPPEQQEPEPPELSPLQRALRRLWEEEQ